jgi:hypothetical protein
MGHPVSKKLFTFFNVSENGGLQFKKTLFRHALLAYVLRLKQVSPKFDLKYETKDKLIQKGNQHYPLSSYTGITHYETMVV